MSIDRRTVTLYRGTAFEFPAFDEDSIGRGADANSALGVCLTEEPADAAEYAREAAKHPNAGEPFVLIVEAEVTRTMIVSSADQFFGMDHERGIQMCDQGDFAVAAKRLKEQGFDSVVADEIGDGTGTWIVFDPARLTITGYMLPDEADEAQSQTLHGHVSMDTGLIFPDLENDIAAMRGSALT